VIIHADLIVSLIIIIAIVELILHGPLSLSLAALSHIEYLRVVDYLLELVLSQVLLCILKGYLRGRGFFDVCEAIHWRGGFEGHVARSDCVH
jgi:hypothetical protein